MTRAEEVLKFLELDYRELVQDKAWVIKPLDFMIDFQIVLTMEHKYSYEMFIWEMDEVINPIKFKIADNICDVYSKLYNFKKKNCESKSKSIRKQN